MVLAGAGLKALHERQRRMTYRIYHDPLTALENRAFLAERGEAAILRAAKAGRPVGLLFLDLDGFKQINDTCGHAIGDRALQVVAERLRATTREGDVIARLGGDEFALLIGRDGGEARCAAVADRLIAAIRQPLAIGDAHPTLGVSVGIAVHPTHGADMKSLLQAADAAMYRAKEAGGNRYELAPGCVAGARAAER
jgi:diguanylate cyclase (GGDEF)-like protein